jgi:hypothetical protein
MSISLKKLFNDYGIGAILVLLILAYCVSLFAKYLTSKGYAGSESNQNMQSQYKNINNQGNASVKPSEPLGQNEVFASANGIQTTMQGMPPSCSTSSISNPSELLPKDTNSQWAQLNPSGKGELANVNLLKAGYHIGIDTIGQSLRNANLQIRSEPPNPQLNVGPWNLSTITPDFMRVPLEIGAGPQ